MFIKASRKLQFLLVESSNGTPARESERIEDPVAMRHRVGKQGSYRTRRVFSSGPTHIARTIRPRRLLST